MTLLRRNLKGLLTVCLPALGALGLMAAKSQSPLLGDVCRFILSALAASLLLFVVRRSLELTKEAARLKAIAAFLPMPGAVQAWLSIADDFNPDEPILPFRFQRPPPFLIA
jgi:hypothetical protein